MIEVKGSVIDKHTRCVHYHSERDVIAIKFYCCKTYFPCVHCHEQHGCGKHVVWPKERFHEKAILCGVCQTELTIEQYMTSNYHCPHCYAAFNPGCQLHAHYYFEM
ncbi:hypothetical protein CI793_04885 [Anoxybacillus ayderensis]|uniref:CHY zinc finger protein n=1 Tax=Anoxybacillus sp. ST70 TaxID=2864180 RepID=UPI0002D9DF52|nr:CHY zinc finger protein [Anoxybacillus sp. ST70]AXM89925.1 hypothetical protein B379_12635 [Anoxybacillus ayderensis G10]MBW9218017.1 hypothetical protein [Anoxybacillus sp. ST70]THD16976.1 hypothetical protein CI793_04885 [Anoxybacillus ayderensis]